MSVVFAISFAVVLYIPSIEIKKAIAIVDKKSQGFVPSNASKYFPIKSAMTIGTAIHAETFVKVKRLSRHHGFVTSSFIVRVEGIGP